jgi:hypothetical protein
VRGLVWILLLGSRESHGGPVCKVLAVVDSGVEVLVKCFVQRFPRAASANVVYVIHARATFQDIWKDRGELLFVDAEPPTDIYKEPGLVCQYVVRLA